MLNRGKTKRFGDLLSLFNGRIQLSRLARRPHLYFAGLKTVLRAHLGRGVRQTYPCCLPRGAEANRRYVRIRSKSRNRLTGLPSIFSNFPRKDDEKLLTSAVALGLDLRLNDLPIGVFDSDPSVFAKFEEVAPSDSNSFSSPGRPR